MNSLIRPLIFAALCAHSAHSAVFAQTAEAQHPPQPIAPTSPPTAAKPESSLPLQELTGQILYQFLLAELAAQRGQFALATGAYVDLAKTTRDPRIARRSAEIAFHAKNLDVALDSARLWLMLEPASAQAKQMMSTLLLATGRVDELAINIGQELKLEGVQVGEALIQLHRAFARYPDKEVLRRLLEQVTQAYLDLPESHFVRAQAALAVRDNERALKSIEQALNLRPEWEYAALVKADMLTRGPAQLDYLKSYLDRRPQALDVRMAYARVLVGEKRHEEARKEFFKVLDGKPDNADAVYAIGILSLQLNDAAESEKQLKRFVSLGRGELDVARYYLGQIADQSGRADEALRWYGEVATGEHALPAKIRAARVLLGQGKPEEARERLIEARRQDPKDVRLLLAEAQLLRDLRRHEEAFVLLSKALAEQGASAANVDSADVIYELALTAEKLGRFEIMESHLRRLIALKPDSAQAYNALGYSLADRNIRLTEAGELLDKSLSLAPEDPFILDSKAWLLFRQGNALGALEMMRKAMAHRPDPEIAAHIGEVLWTLGRENEALAVWSEALKAYPKNEALITAIQRFKP